MKTIGLIGGMSWESTVTYYQLINDYVKDRLGGLHSAKLLLYSVDFEEIERWQASGDWDKSAQRLTEIAKKLEGAGADFIVICTNTMHKVAPQMEKELSIPILHIADATADALLAAGIRIVGLLGTKYTMTQGAVRGDPRRGRGGAGEQRDLSGTVPGRRPGGVAGLLPADHRPAEGQGGPGGDPGLYGDRAAHQPGGFQSACVRHHPYPRGGRGTESH